MRLTCSVLCSLFLILGSAAALAQEDEADKQLTEEQRIKELTKTQEKIADLLEQKGDLAAAQKVWQELLTEHPTSARLMGHVCRLAVELKQTDKVLELSQKLVKLRPKKAQYRVWLAQSLLAHNKRAEAVKHLEWVAKHDTKDTSARAELAAIYSLLKQPVKALAQYDWLIARQPKQLDYHLARFYLLGDLKRLKQQAAELKTLLRLAPKDLRVLMELAGSQMDQDQFNKAEATYKKVLAQKPKHKAAKAGLRKVRRQRRRAAQQSMEAYRWQERTRDWQRDLWERSEDI